jgi:hypothetical protein
MLNKMKTMRRKANPAIMRWIKHLKAFSKKHGMKYNQAMRDPRAKMTFIQ